MYDEKLDMRNIAAIISRRRKILYGILGTAIFAALLFSFLQPTKYEGTVSVRVQYPRGASDNAAVLPSEALIQQQILTYAEIAKSRAVVQPVIDYMYADKAEEKPLYEDMIKLIDAKPVRGTDMLVLSILAGTPSEAQKAADYLLTTFNAKLTDIARLQGKESRLFIGERMGEAKKELDNAERLVVDYKAKNKTVSVSDQTRSFVERQANLKRLSVDNQLALEKAWAQMKSPTLIADTPTITFYKGRLSDQEAEVASLLKNYTEGHPKIKSLRAAMEENRAKLQGEVDRIAKSEVTLWQNQKATLDRLSSLDENEMATLPAKEQGLARLMLNYTVAQDMYVMLAKRYEEARISEVMQPNNIQIVDVASVPEEPARPRWWRNLAIAGILGLFAGVTSAFLAEYFNKTIDTAEDVNLYLGLRVIGSIPSYTSRKEQEKAWNSYKPGIPQVIKSAEAKSLEG
jgi:uncharacterized protein involved in exopolysaccharide biosynthesis